MNEDKSGKPAETQSVEFPTFEKEVVGGDGPSAGENNFDLLVDVNIELSVELGRRKMPFADVLKLNAGNIIELNKLVGEPLEVCANGRLIAEGEVVVVDEQFGVRITRIVTSSQRQRALL